MNSFLRKNLNAIITSSVLSSTAISKSNIYQSISICLFQFYDMSKTFTEQLKWTHWICLRYQTIFLAYQNQFDNNLRPKLFQLKSIDAESRRINKIMSNLNFLAASLFACEFPNEIMNEMQFTCLKCDGIC